MTPSTALASKPPHCDPGALGGNCSDNLPWPQWLGVASMASKERSLSKRGGRGALRATHLTTHGVEGAKGRAPATWSEGGGSSPWEGPVETREGPRGRA